MIRKRLIGMLKESKKYVAGIVLLRWLGLFADICIIFAIAFLLQRLLDGTAGVSIFLPAGLTAAAALFVRFISTEAAGRMSHLASKSVKRTLRQKIFEKLLTLGPAYKEQTATAELVQVSVEGVDQLETYFGAYLPQLFYSLLAPLTLFTVLSFVSLPAAAVLLICVPLIPLSIAAVQTFAKKLFSRYWGHYISLGDTFLENLQGMTTLKIYQADERKQQEMNREAEQFRKITMKVLRMQLNSVIVMDVIAYGGAAVGIILAVLKFQQGQVSLAGALAIILLSAEFFLPMRQLGSFFHIAMNGLAASDKIFEFLDLPEPAGAPNAFPDHSGISCRELHFSYEAHREILHGIDMDFPACSLTAVVGESGSGKSTFAALTAGRRKGYSGSLTVDGIELSDIRTDSLLRSVTYVGHDSALFKGTVRYNLQIGCPTASDAQMWSALERARLADFLRGEQGLNTRLAEGASNLSGGQRQRLAFARALLHDSSVYIFDEAVSNIDAQSEAEIMAEIRALAKRKTVIFITHRLAGTQNADGIYVLQNGSVAESGTCRDLMAKGELFASLWNAQQALETYTKEGAQ